MIIDYYIEKDLAERYAKNRKGMEVREAEELISIIFSYIRSRMESNETYAIQTPIGYFYRDHMDIDEFLKSNLDKRSKEYQLKEKMFINQLTKQKPTQSLKYKDVKTIKERTNNS